MATGAKWMSGLLGAVGGAVSGVGGFVGTVVTNVIGGVLEGARDVAYGTSQELCDADQEPIYEQRARVDQVLHFFDLEYEKYSGFFEDRERIESLRIEYCNCVNAIEFQNEMLAQLVDEVLQLRQLLRSGRVGDGDAVVNSRKELGIRLANLKLDISDRKTKRFFKEKDRKNLLETLSPAIAGAKMQRFLAEQAEQGSAPAATRMEERPSIDPEPKSGGARRRYKHYSDAEIATLLREKAGRRMLTLEPCAWSQICFCHVARA
eukprot:s3255_g5.t1